MKTINNVQKQGTLVLFSLDGLTFSERDLNNTNNRLNLLDGIQYPHVFKYSIDGIENWYMLYQNSSGQIKYSRLNWTSAFSVEI